MTFVNRFSELDILDKASPGLYVLYGRRRIGKSTLIGQWAKKRKVYQSQAVEGSQGLQISQLFSDIQELIPNGIIPRTWSELFSSLSLVKNPAILVIDEFPYLVKTSPELPSIIQKWVDRQRPKDFTLVLLGSSQTMMHSLFLDSRSPLYERALVILHLPPLNYKNYCDSLSLDIFNSSTFENFSIVGGVPKYWEFISSKDLAVDNATYLFFQDSARLENEPDRLLKDENISGQQAKSVLEAIGRGASRPSEIASRLEINQSSLSTIFQILTNSSIVSRESPFPDSSKDVKKTLYQISDCALRFWYRVYSPHRSRWHLYSKKQQAELIHIHASNVLEDCFRGMYKDARRYWEGGNIEIDSVRYDQNDLKSVILTEIKHTNLSKSQVSKEELILQDKFNKSKLSKLYTLSSLEVLDTKAVIDRLLKESR